MNELEKCKKKEIGVIDQPTSIDNLGMDKYMEGVAKFIKTTRTPLSISIQGDWGSGKTSLLKGIETKLNENQDEKNGQLQPQDTTSNVKVKVVWFNVWEESQLNMGN